MICHLNKVTNKVCVEYISEYIYIYKYIYMYIYIYMYHPVNLVNNILVNEMYKDLREGMGNRESRLWNECITRAHLISKFNISDMRHMKYARNLQPGNTMLTHLIVKNYNYGVITVL